MHDQKLFSIHVLDFHKSILTIGNKCSSLYQGKLLDVVGRGKRNSYMVDMDRSIEDWQLWTSKKTEHFLKETLLCRLRAEISQLEAPIIAEQNHVLSMWLWIPLSNGLLHRPLPTATKIISLSKSSILKNENQVSSVQPNLRVFLICVCTYMYGLFPLFPFNDFRSSSG